MTSIPVLELVNSILITHQDPLLGHGHVLGVEHLLEQDPARTIGDLVTHLLQIIVRDQEVIYVNILVLPAEALSISITLSSEEWILSIAFNTKYSDLNSFPLSQINYHRKKRFQSCVFNLKYLSQNLIKLDM